MSARKWRLGSGLVAAFVMAISLIGAAPKAQADASASECVPVCFKHPITGELLCTPPCP